MSEAATRRGPRKGRIDIGQLKVGIPLTDLRGGKAVLGRSSNGVDRYPCSPNHWLAAKRPSAALDLADRPYIELLDAISKGSHDLRYGHKEASQDLLRAPSGTYSLRLREVEPALIHPEFDLCERLLVVEGTKVIDGLADRWKTDPLSNQIRGYPKRDEVAEVVEAPAAPVMPDGVARRDEASPGPR
ncbi:MAG TPA: hypothetical protein VKY90_02665 [Candidatus Dormibacteraeota bacterium]|nr:hypothetical protein [Candidatus Dormibacteraeota bacterium]